MRSITQNLYRRMAASLLSLFALLFASVALAQTNQGGGASIDITTRSTETVWYGQWWVWAVGVAVFLIIIIALTNRGGRTT